MRKYLILSTALASLSSATGALAQTTFPEVEPNSLKTEATSVVGIVSGDVITGTTTGTSTTPGSTLVSTVDMFRVRTAALPPGLYQHRLSLTSDTPGQSGSIRSQDGQSGVACGGGTALGGEGFSAQQLFGTPNYNIWYGFGNQEELYYRVEGSGATASAYGAVLTTTPVAPTVIAPVFEAGAVTISTVGLTTVDTEIVLYDAAGNLVGQNDHECPQLSAQSKLTRTLAPGTYYVGVTTFELCVDQPAPVDDAFFGVLVDFPGCVVLSYASGAFQQDWDFEIRACNGNHSQSNLAPANAPFVIPWYQITVAAGAPPISLPTNDNCASATLISTGTLTGSFGAATHDGTASCDPGGLASRDLWYSFSNPAGGTFTASTCGSAGVDTVLSVYDACGGTEIACNDDCGVSCGAPLSCIGGVNLAPNQQIWIRVSDKGLGGCGFTLTTTFGPANDSCLSPGVLPAPGNYPIDTTSASTGPDGQTEAICNYFGATAVNKDLWYRYTAQLSGTITVSTCGLLMPGFEDAKIAVYATNTCPAAGTAIVCNDDFPCPGFSGFNSTVSFPTTCGQAYMIQIGYYGNFTGGIITGQFNLSETGTVCSTPAVPECISDTAVLCPCSGPGGSLVPNPGSPGNGCGNSAFPAGANLASSGNALDNAGDTLVLTCSNMPGPGLFFQSNAVAGPFINFNDGTLCAAIGIIRMGVVFPTSGVASYPGGLTPNPIHIAGAPVLAPTPTKHYQCWYRDITPGFCNVPGHNMSNGLAIVWTP